MVKRNEIKIIFIILVFIVIACKVSYEIKGDIGKASLDEKLIIQIDSL